MENKKSGILYGIGMGPGDPELITYKAVKRIEACPVIAVPCKNKADSVAYKIACGAVKNLQEKEIAELDMPMTKDPEIIDKKHKECAKKVMEYLKSGRDVAFLTLGDPTIYSTHLYINRLVEEEGFATSLISGVPSFCAVAARLNRGLVEKEEMLHLIPASYPLDEALQLPGTKVLMKAGKKIPQMKEALRKTQAAVSMIENCGMENEKIYEGIEEIPDNAGYFSLVIVK